MANKLPLSNASVESIPVLLDGIFATAARRAGMSLNSFAAGLLYAPSDFPVDAGGLEMVRCMPPTTVDGRLGLRKSDVLFVGKTPTSYEDMYSQPFAEVIPLWADILRKSQVDPSTWLCHYVCPFLVPAHLAGSGKIKAGYLKECKPLLSAVYRECQPKLVVASGADAFAAVISLFDEKQKAKIGFTDSRGDILELPDGTLLVAIYSASSLLKNSEELPQFENDLRIVANAAKTIGLSSGDLEESSIHTQVPFIEIETLADLDTKLPKFPDNSRVSVDLEWGPKTELRTMQLCSGEDLVYVIVFNRAGMVPTELGKNTPAAVKILQSKFSDKVGVIGHNVRGDIKILRKLGLDLLPNFKNLGFDTLLSYHIIPGNETLDKKLELVVSRMLQSPRYDHDLRRWLSDNKYGEKEYEKFAYGYIPDNILHPYAAMDAYVTHKLAKVVYEEMGKHEGIRELYFNLMHPLTEPVLEMEETGLLVDTVRLTQLTDMFHEKVALIKRDIQVDVNWVDTESTQVTHLKNGSSKQKQVFHEGFNLDSPPQVQEILFGRFKEKDGIPVRKSPPGAKILNLTPTHSTDGTDWADVVASGKEAVFSPSTDAKTLGMLAGDSPIVKKIADYKTVSQVKKTLLREYIRDSEGRLVFDGGIGGHIGSDGRIHTTFRTTLETGRYSTSDPSLQNLPKRKEKDIKRCFLMSDGSYDPRYRSVRSSFIASPGHVLIEADWNQAELWTMGYIAKDYKFIDALQKSDFHTQTMQLMFGQMEHQGKSIASYSVEELNTMRKTDKFLDSLRISAKAVVFGIPYGRGAAAIAAQVRAEGVECSAADTKGWIDTFYASYPDVAAFLNECKAAVTGCGYVRNPYGRYRMFQPSNVNSVIAGMQREALNFPIQSTVGDSMTVALINLFMYRKISPNISYKILLSIHDAVLLEVPYNCVEAVCEEVLPFCMCEAVEVPKIGLRYALGEFDVSTRWGESDEPSYLESLGIPRKYCGYSDN